MERDKKTKRRSGNSTGNKVVAKDEASELSGQEAFARAMKLKLKANREALEAKKASEKAAQASERPDLSGAALRRGLEDEILARHPRLTREKLQEFMKYT